MMRALAICILAACCAGTIFAGDAAGAGTAQGRQVPYQVMPMEAFSAAIKDWADESMPHYAIMNHAGEWDLAFQPARTPDDKRPFRPQPSFFEKAWVVAISRVSEAPPPGQRTLAFKSLAITEGQLVLTYSFIPPPPGSGRKVKSTLLVAIPANVQYDLRIIEDTETPESLAAQRELEEAIREGRFKPQPLPQGNPAETFPGL